MDKIHVYHISIDDLGEKYMFYPRVPDTTMDKEDKSIPRICVCPTIIGCIRAIYPTQLGIYDINLEIIKRNGTQFWIYEGDVDVSKIYQPTIKDVPDSYITGELWIIEPQELLFTKKVIIRKHMELPNCYYSRFSVTEDGCDEIVNKVIADVIYGHNQYNFSYIDCDTFRWDEAVKYAEEHQ